MNEHCHSLVVEVKTKNEGRSERNFPFDVDNVCPIKTWHIIDNKINMNFSGWSIWRILLLHYLSPPFNQFFLFTRKPEPEPLSQL